ncbi:DUF4105 domain-containing protein [Prevotella koreensis]|uniref:Lnb N-terminal periplasmic domain-containing protein n=1 Tax=Prevotella koreensis TaxID=2490854 RepID=UPI0028E880E4|nr:DUF4105 domain-containing protein [Prevotella koreensis]
MKQIISILKVFILAITMLNTTLLYGQKKGLSPDSLEISLLTCSPRQKVYSLYGHTAIRLRDVRTGLDVAVNYGVFSFDKPLFIPRFVLGITDYEIGVIPFKYFIAEYREAGSSITQQVLNLTSDEKMLIFDAIETNMLPENKYYRYNFFYDNCTTRARDILTRNINGGVTYMPHEGGTYRDIIHQKNEQHPWARFGNDLLLGIGADMVTTQEQRQFLPENLMRDFDKATRNDNHTPLTDTTMVILEGGTQIIESEFPFTPTQCALFLLITTIIITTIEIIKKKNLRYFDAFLMLFTSIIGTLLFLMIFSQHPTVRVNLQILLLNPLPLFFIRRMLKRQKNNTKDWQYIIWTMMICLFFVGGFFQSYAEGMYILALSLLIRNLKGILLFYRNASVTSKE